MLLNKAQFTDNVFAPDIKTYVNHGSAQQYNTTARHMSSGKWMGSNL